MPRFVRLSWLVLTTLAVVAAGSSGGCSDNHKKKRAAPEEMPDAGSDALDELGEPSPGVAMALGRACSKDQDCGLELECIEESSSDLVRGGPPRGLCTTSCADDPGICKTLKENALCVAFGDGAFCVESCEYGTPDPMAFDRDKCHGRREFACRPVLAGRGAPCELDRDCAADEACDGRCRTIATACMPQCNGDFDCAAGRFCDPKTGECIDEVPVGSQLGASCQPGADDACRGVCAQVGGAMDWRCAEPCTLGVYPSCGSPTDPAAVGCAVSSDPLASFGDLGWCAELCDCNRDCPIGRDCITTDREYLRRPGYCGVAEADSRVRSMCPDEGTGGSGGTGSGSGGSGGSGGSSSGGTGGEAGSPASAGQAGQGS